jgi:hypothetical protein
MLYPADQDSYAVCALPGSTPGPMLCTASVLKRHKQLDVGCCLLNAWVVLPSYLHPQAAKTYLEKHYESFQTASLDTLIRHGLKALAGSLSDGELTSQVGRQAGRAVGWEGEQAHWTQAGPPCSPEVGFYLECAVAPSTRSEPRARASHQARRQLYPLSACAELPGPQNTAVAIVGAGTPFTILEDEGIEPYISALKEEEGPMAVEAPPPAEVSPSGWEGSSMGVGAHVPSFEHDSK